MDEERKSASRRWMIHTHSYGTGTDPDMGHQHQLVGISCPAKMTRRRLHVHVLSGRTTFTGTNAVEMHWHAYEVTTEFAVEMPDGNHVHFYTGITSVDAGHRHTFSGSTNLGPDTYFNNSNTNFNKNNRPDEDSDTDE